MERDLCMNCGHWREEHYGAGGQFIADKTIHCYEYQGTVPSPQRRERKARELASVAASSPLLEPDYGLKK